MNLDFNLKWEDKYFDLLDNLKGEGEIEWVIRKN